MCLVFFVQAEDGIRYLVRSRGLGDVYKRQIHGHTHQPAKHDHIVDGIHVERWVLADWHEERGAVSYTHLTLPTSDLG